MRVPSTSLIFFPVSSQLNQYLERKCHALVSDKMAVRAAFFIALKMAGACFSPHGVTQGPSACCFYAFLELASSFFY